MFLAIILRRRKLFEGICPLKKKVWATCDDQCGWEEWPGPGHDAETRTNHKQVDHTETDSVDGDSDHQHNNTEEQYDEGWCGAAMLNQWWEGVEL